MQKNFIDLAQDTEFKEKWDYDQKAVQESVSSFELVVAETSATLNAMLSEAKHASGQAAWDALGSRLKQVEQQSKDKQAQCKKAIKLFGNSITKQDKQDMKASKTCLLAAAESKELCISEKSSTLEQLFFHARMTAALKDGYNCKPKISNESVAIFRVGADALDAAAKEPSLRASLKMLDNHLKANGLAYGNVVLQNQAKAFQLQSTLGLPVEATARLAFPPTAHAWAKTLFAPQVFKEAKGYEYAGVLPLALGEARFIVKGKEWWAAVLYEKAMGEDYTQKLNNLKTAKCPKPAFSREQSAS